MNWTNNGEYIKGTYKQNISNDNIKVASFDLDGTLIKPTDNKKFSETDSDWEFYVKEIPDKIKKLYLCFIKQNRILSFTKR